MPTVFGFKNSKGELIPLTKISKAYEEFDDFEYENLTIPKKYQRYEICPLYHVLEWMAISGQSIEDTIMQHPADIQRLRSIFKWLYDQVDLVSFLTSSNEQQ